MKLCVSAIAWNADEEARAFSLLASNQVHFIEHVPARVASIAPQLRTLQLELVAFQALLFGTSGLQLFRSDAERSALETHLNTLCVQAGSLGARALIFGSPKNRSIDPSLDRATAEMLALEFFRRVGKVAEENHCCVCLEPNPTAYGCNFLTTTAETANFVNEVHSNGIKLNLDAGALAMNGEAPEDILDAHRAIVGHIHVSEPHLAPIGSVPATLDNHNRLAKKLRALNYGGVVSIEMLRPGDQAFEPALGEAIRFVRDTYGAR
jgi:sugar phosphate isomerase/epimerase